MSEDENTKVSSGVLANALVSQGLKKMHEYHKRAAEYTRNGGMNELADKHDSKAKVAIANASLMEPSLYLNEEENKRYLELLSRRYGITTTGRLYENKVNESDKEELLKLVNKANPPKKDEDL